MTVGCCACNVILEDDVKILHSIVFLFVKLLIDRKHKMCMNNVVEITIQKHLTEIPIVLYNML